MITTIEKFEESLKGQLSHLTDKIRSAEAELMNLKEGYLKVQGAIEILDLLKKEVPEDSSDELSDDDAITAVAEVF